VSVDIVCIRSWRPRKLGKHCEDSRTHALKRPYLRGVLRPDLPVVSATTVFQSTHLLLEAHGNSVCRDRHLLAERPQASGRRLLQLQRTVWCSVLYCAVDASWPWPWPPPTQRNMFQRLLEVQRHDSHDRSLEADELMAKLHSWVASNTAVDACCICIDAMKVTPRPGPPLVYPSGPALSMCPAYVFAMQQGESVSSLPCMHTFQSGILAIRARGCTAIQTSNVLGLNGDYCTTVPPVGLSRSNSADSNSIDRPHSRARHAFMSGSGMGAFAHCASAVRPVASAARSRTAQPSSSLRTASLQRELLTATATTKPPSRTIALRPPRAAHHAPPRLTVLARSRARPPALAVRCAPLGRPTANRSAAKLACDCRALASGAAPTGRSMAWALE
jgi:hypothetical protein